MAARSAATNSSGAPCRRSAAATASGIRLVSVAAGASGTNTGSSVRWFTSSATCGFQNSAVANQSPSTVVDSSPSMAAGPLTRSRSFLVPRSTSTEKVSQLRNPGHASAAPLLPEGLTTQGRLSPKSLRVLHTFVEIRRTSSTRASSIRPSTARSPSPSPAWRASFGGRIAWADARRWAVRHRGEIQFDGWTDRSMVRSRCGPACSGSPL